MAEEFSTEDEGNTEVGVIPGGTPPVEGDPPPPPEPNIPTEPPIVDDGGVA